jgi:predicted nucleic-acid-binding protein
MKAPDVIYLAESDKVKGEVSSNFASENPFKTHTSIAYIRKEALLEKVKELRDDAGSRDDHYEKDAIIEYNAYEAVMDIIKSM